ncbi:MAG: AraC family transcriptional regulator ligand-binding domain-containing protein, partial [Acidobacteriota bacterium]
MSYSNVFTVGPGWRILLLDVDLSPVNVLRRAGLPDDLFARQRATLDSGQYFRLWRSIGEEADDPEISLRLATSISMEAFDPPIFAAMCSADLNTALQRLARHKRLLAPMALHVDIQPSRTDLELEWFDDVADAPEVLVATELVFFVQIARMATRTEIQPLFVRSPRPLEPRAAYEAYFGIPVETGGLAKISYRADDATRPFLTVNDAMWSFFEPELRRRLSELDATATMADRVHGALLELLPGGGASAKAVARKLAVSTRTLQRRLQEEGESFRSIVSATREQLAWHYLKSSAISGAEISYLLGFDDPNSFFRAFQGWTGQT